MISIRAVCGGGAVRLTSIHRNSMARDGVKQLPEHNYKCQTRCGDERQAMRNEKQSRKVDE